MRAERARALWFTAPRSADLRPETVPPPGPNEVRVRSSVSAISHGTEMLAYRGEVARDLPLDLPTFSGSFAFPLKYGYAAVGEILDAGDGIAHLSPGDPVFVHHPHQDVFVVPGNMPVRLPEGIEPEHGVFAANLETAVNIVHDTPLLLGETALVFGQGVVGLLVTQLLKLSGARVLAVEPVRRRRELSRELGADDVFEPGEDLADHVREKSGERGADVAIEVSGVGEALQAAIDSVAVEGTVVVASWYGTKPVGLALGENFHRGRVRLRSSQVGRLSPESSARWDHNRRMETVMSLLPKLELEKLISHRMPFGKAPEAYRLLDEKPTETVQVILAHDGEIKGG